jgi:hypothetical protein
MWGRVRTGAGAGTPTGAFALHPHPITAVSTLAETKHAFSSVITQDPAGVSNRSQCSHPPPSHRLSGLFRPHPEYIAVLVAQSSIAIIVDMSTKYIAIQVSHPCIAVTLDCSPKFIRGVVVVPLAHLNIAWWRGRIRKRSAIWIRHAERRWFNGDVPAIVLRKRLTRYQDCGNDSNHPSFAVLHEVFSLRERD